MHAVRAFLFLSLLALPAAAELGTWSPFGPTGADVISLAAAPSDTDVVYAGSRTGAFRSDDGGETWAQTAGIGGPFWVASLGVHPAFPDTVLAGIQTFNELEPIWRSTDGGATWTPKSQGLPINGTVLSLVFEPSNPRTLLGLTSEDGIWRSTDAGDSWQRLGVEFGDAVPARLEGVPGQPGHYLTAATGIGVLRSTDGGDTWGPFNDGLPLSNVRDLVLDPSDPGTLYVIGFGELYRSVDGGAWTELPIGLPPVAYRSALATGGDLWLGTTGALWRSADGQAWGQVAELQRSGDVQALKALPGTLLAGTEYGILRSGADVATWSPANTGLHGTVVQSLVAIPTEDGTRVVASTQPLLEDGMEVEINDDRGKQDWTRTAVGAGSFDDIVAIPDEPGRLLAGSDDGLWTSDDAGETWRRFPSPLDGRRVAKIAVPTSNPDVWYAGIRSAPEVYRSVDRGATWTPTGPGLVGLELEDLTVNPELPNLLLVATAGDGGLFRSFDSGDSWVRLPNRFGLPPFGDTFSVSITPQQPLYAFAGFTGSRVLRSTDGGFNWGNLFLPATEPEDVILVAADPARFGVVFAATPSALYRSADAGESWTRVDTGISRFPITDLAFDPAAPAQVFVGTLGGGIYRATFPSDDANYLQRDRFEVSARWRDFAGEEDDGVPVGLSGDTGYFWFFDDANVELIVKVLDGRPVNDHFWVFYGALSNVEYDLRLVDLDTGEAKIYSNPVGTFASVGDTFAFEVDGAPLQSTGPLPAGLHPPGELRTSRSTVPRDGPCTAGVEALCLNAERFRVEVEYRDPDDVEGRGQAVPLTGDTGYFWFFDDANVELVVKVLDGRPLNGNFWVFYGALSNVEFTLTVTDTVTGEVQEYRNPEGTFASVGDTSAFVGVDP